MKHTRLSKHPDAVGWAGECGLDRGSSPCHPQVGHFAGSKRAVVMADRDPQVL